MAGQDASTNVGRLAGMLGLSRLRPFKNGLPEDDGIDDPSAVEDPFPQAGTWLLRSADPANATPGAAAPVSAKGGSRSRSDGGSRDAKPFDPAAPAAGHDAAIALSETILPATPVTAATPFIFPPDCPGTSTSLSAGVNGGAAFDAAPGSSDLIAGIADPTATAAGIAVPGMTSPVAALTTDSPASTPLTSQAPGPTVDAMAVSSIDAGSSSPFKIKPVVPATINTGICCGTCGFVNCPIRPLDFGSLGGPAPSAVLPGGGSPQNSSTPGPGVLYGSVTHVAGMSQLQSATLPGGGPETNSSSSSSTPAGASRGAVTNGSDGTTSQSGVSNAITLENQKPGNPESEWGIDGAGDSNIEGFATDISVNHGTTVSFKINTDSNNYRIDIYRLGYYGGDGARLVSTIQHNGVQNQPAALVDPKTGEVDAGNWAVSASWNVPVDAVSGVYIAKLTRQDGTAGENQIPFIVRDDSSHSDIVFQTSDETWQAYNGWGGANLYGGNGPATGQGAGRAYAISYNRPIATRGDVGTYAGPQDYLFGAEYGSISWLEQNGYDVSYITGVDADRSGSLLLNHKLFLDSGHDEYWTGQQRANVEAARDAGVNLSFWSGNEVYWKGDLTKSFSADATPNRTLTVYKDTFANQSINPSGDWTGTYRDTRNPNGADPENSLTGQLFKVDSYRSDTLTIPSTDANLRFWRNTSVASLTAGQTASLPQDYLGYEWDEAPDDASAPAGLVRLSSTTLNVGSYVLDNGNTTGNGTATHSLTLYRAPSGALVFGAGTVFWSWGLSNNHDIADVPTDPRVQQAMVNLFADMGIQPGTLQSGLVKQAGSTDRTAPTSTITSPTGSATAQSTITIAGTATDAGGGVVAGVEVSTDNGASWHAATGRATWTYAWSPQVAGSYKILSRAVDDSVNLETPSSGRTVSITAPSYTTLFPGGATPDVTNALDQSAVELGVRFQTSAAGTVSGIRFYKSSGDTGTHTGELWSSSGTLLATATFANETASGWQSVTFSKPVTLSTNTTYVASYHTNVGNYSDTQYTFEQPITNGPLTAPADTASSPNGVYVYSATSKFPTQNTQAATNFWVDVMFNRADPTNHNPVAVADSGYTTSTNTALTIAGSELLGNDSDPDGDTISITGVSGATNGTATFNASANTVTFTPTTGYNGTASFTYAVADGHGGTASASVGLTVAAPGTAPTGLFSASATPAVVNSADINPGELGVKFQASSAGAISGVRFFKGSGDVGTHTGELWSSTGTLLATATFTNESTSGWQTVTFANPVSIAANTTYVASYHTNSGHYSSSANYFTTATTNGPLTGLASSASGGNGVYDYGPNRLFPTSSFQATNYWVDVLYNQAGTLPNRNPVAVNDSGFTTEPNTALTIAAGSLLGNDTDPDSDALTITGVSGASNGTVSFNASANTVTFTPTAGYTGSAGFSYAITDGRGGTASASVGLTVATPGSAPTGLFAASATPAVTSEADSGSVELGVKFQASAAGTISGIRFYKGAGNTGTHTGELWSSTGTLLATATFTNESASGWQTVTFANPVSIAANTTYVASYHAPVGHYADTSNYFASPTTNGALTAPSGSNGVYGYGSGALFPTSTYQATNYWVDVLYNQGATAPNRVPVAANDSGFTTPTNTALTIAASALLGNDTDPDGDPLTITGVSGATNGTATFNTSANTVTFTPTAGYTGSASFNYAIADGRGGTASASVGLTVATPGSAPTGLFAASATPAVTSESDSGSVELGVKFQASAAGTISGIRFYKGAGNTGTHTGELWSSTGTLLATATFTNESASGWQTVTFANPVSIAANTTYVASYHAPVGHYADTSNYFASPTTNGALTAPSGSNGVYGYGSGALFPTSTYQATNYWVDVLYNQGATAPNRVPVAANDSGFTTPTNTALTIAASALLGNDTDPDGDPLTITGVSGATNGTATFNTSANTVTFTPTAGYTGSASFNYAIADGRGGTASASVGLTVGGSTAGTSSLFASTSTPAVVNTADINAVELGVKFQAASSGTVTAIKFYKGTQDTGTHTGEVWSATGTLLERATFTNESASGWQTATFATPISIAANTTYVASYHTNTGHYSSSANFFASDVTNGPLKAPSDSSAGGNGVYVYAAASAFPTNSFQKTNYWVDVAFNSAA